MCFGKSFNYTCESIKDESLVPIFIEDFMCDGDVSCDRNRDEIEEHCSWRFYCEDLKETTWWIKSSLNRNKLHQISLSA